MTGYYSRSPNKTSNFQYNYKGTRTPQYGDKYSDSRANQYTPSPYTTYSLWKENQIASKWRKDQYRWNNNQLAKDTSSPRSVKPIFIDTAKIDVTKPRPKPTPAPAQMVEKPMVRDDQMGTIKRGRTVVRMHTKMLKENPYLKKNEKPVPPEPQDEPEIKIEPKFNRMSPVRISRLKKRSVLQYNRHDSNSKNWLDSDSSSSSSDSEGSLKRENTVKSRNLTRSGTIKRDDTVKRRVNIGSKSQSRDLSQSIDSANKPTTKKTERRLSVEMYEEQAAIFDSMIKEELARKDADDYFSDPKRGTVKIRGKAAASRKESVKRKSHSRGHSTDSNTDEEEQKKKGSRASRKVESSADNESTASERSTPSSSRRNSLFQDLIIGETISETFIEDLENKIQNSYTNPEKILKGKTPKLKVGSVKITQQLAKKPGRYETHKSNSGANISATIVEMEENKPKTPKFFIQDVKIEQSQFSFSDKDIEKCNKEDIKAKTSKIDEAKLVEVDKASKVIIAKPVEEVLVIKPVPVESKQKEIVVAKPELREVPKSAALLTKAKPEMTTVSKPVVGTSSTEELKSTSAGLVTKVEPMLVAKTPEPVAKPEPIVLPKRVEVEAKDSRNTSNSESKAKVTRETSKSPIKEERKEFVQKSTEENKVIAITLEATAEAPGAVKIAVPATLSPGEVREVFSDSSEVIQSPPVKGEPSPTKLKDSQQSEKLISKVGNEGLDLNISENSEKNGIFKLPTQLKTSAIKEIETHPVPFEPSTQTTEQSVQSSKELSPISPFESIEKAETGKKDESIKLLPTDNKTKILGKGISEKLATESNDKNDNKVTKDADKNAVKPTETKVEVKSRKVITGLKTKQAIVGGKPENLENVKSEKSRGVSVENKIKSVKPDSPKENENQQKIEGKKSAEAIEPQAEPTVESKLSKKEEEQPSKVEPNGKAIKTVIIVKKSTQRKANTGRKSSAIVHMKPRAMAIRTMEVHPPSLKTPILAPLPQPLKAVIAVIPSPEGSESSEEESEEESTETEGSSEGSCEDSDTSTDSMQGKQRKSTSSLDSGFGSACYKSKKGIALQHRIVLILA